MVGKIGKVDQYHYSQCGLQNVFLRNGFVREATPYGETIRIHDMDGLHLAIGMHLIRDKERLSGAEARFLRHELDLSQEMLGRLLKKSGQSVARWEKDETKIDGPADRLLRLLYENHAQPSNDGGETIRSLLERLSELDSGGASSVAFEDTESGWRVCDAA